MRPSPWYILRHMKVAVLIPVYNEAQTLRELIARFDATPPPVHPTSGQPLVRRLVLVDDGSTDGSWTILQSLKDRGDTIVERHDHNRGKGAALRTALKAALAEGADALIIHDADLEYDPRDHDAVLDPILTGRADAVIGTRFRGRAHRVLYFWHYVANRLITLLSNMLTNLNLSDIECCTKAFTRRVAQQLTITERRFGVEPEIVARLARMRLRPPESRAANPTESPTESPADHPRTDQPERALRIFEVSVSYSGRTYAEGKKITWRDGISAIRCILVYNLLR